MAYPLPKFSFLVDWNGTNISFSEVSGLKQELEIIEYREGDSPEHAKIKMPGIKKYGDLTFKRGTFQDKTDFYDWMETVQLNDVERRDITISLLGADGSPAATWKASGAFPMSIEPTDLKGDGNEVAVETIVVAIEKLSLVK